MQLITRLIKWLFILFFLLGVLSGMLVVSSIEKYAIVKQPAELTANELKRVRQFIRSNNPAKLHTGQTTQSIINEEDLNLLLGYISQKAPGRLNRKIRASVILDKDQVYLQASLELPANPIENFIGSFINLTAELAAVEAQISQRSTQAHSVEKNKLVKINSLSIGKISLPAFVINPVMDAMHSDLKQLLPEYELISNSLNRIDFKNDKLIVNYTWNSETANTIKTQLSSRVISAELKQAVIAQSNHLARLSYNLPNRPSLNVLFSSMFDLALQRSQTSKPELENQAVFIVLAAYALNRNMATILGEQTELNIKYQRIYLKRRHDLSKHLMLSAAITSMADSNLAESIGLEKEVRDSKGGSGFSFADLAADHAGIELAKYALTSEGNARHIQKFLSEVDAESDYMPDINNLPEGIQQTEFTHNYNNTQSEAYRKIQDLIKMRIALLPVYQTEIMD